MQNQLLSVKKFQQLYIFVLINKISVSLKNIYLNLFSVNYQLSTNNYERIK